MAAKQGSGSRVSHKAGQFTESVIREMTRLANQHGAINLSQGFPDFPAPEFIKEAACEAIRSEINQYAITWGSLSLRQSLARYYQRFYGFRVDPEREMTVCCGATESMISAMLATVNPGQNVIIFEPFYENYGPDAIISGATPHFVSLDPENDFSFDLDELRALATSLQGSGGVRALILNTPNNPTGKVFSLQELEQLARLAIEFDFYILTDEIYEHIIYEGDHHLMAALPEMRERTITISGLSKTFSVTGWRIGYVLAPPDVTSAIRKMHDFLTVGAPAPLQEAGARALEAPDSYFEKLRADYTERRDFLVGVLRDSGFRVWEPRGAYYIMAEITGLTDLDDVQFVDWMIRNIGVAAVPGSSFYHRPEMGRHLIRFAFCKTMDLLQEAAHRLQRLTSA